MNPPVPPSPSPPPASHHVVDARCFMEDNPGYLIKQVYLSMNRMLDQQMAPLGLTASQWRPIAMLFRGNADTPAELARLNGVDTGAMTRTLDRLEAKGLLQRERCHEDRRVVKIMLTEEGEAKAREIPANIAHMLSQHLRGFDADEATRLMHYLRRMLANGSDGGFTP